MQNIEFLSKAQLLGDGTTLVICLSSGGIDKFAGALSQLSAGQFAITFLPAARVVEMNSYYSVNHSAWEIVSSAVLSLSCPKIVLTEASSSEIIPLLNKISESRRTQGMNFELVQFASGPEASPIGGMGGIGDGFIGGPVFTDPFVASIKMFVQSEFDDIVDAFIQNFNSNTMNLNKVGSVVMPSYAAVADTQTVVPSIGQAAALLAVTTASDTMVAIPDPDGNGESEYRSGNWYGPAVCTLSVKYLGRY